MLCYDPKSYEKETTPILQIILKKKDRPVVIDVGANWGQTIFKIKYLSKHAIVHSFEAFPQMIQCLDKIVKINKWEDVFLNNLMLGSKKGPTQIFFKKESGMDTASPLENFQPDFDSVYTANSITLDEYVDFHKINSVTILKIDVEGGELEVIQGAQNMLKKMKPDILLELLYSPGERQRQTIELLKQLGYLFYWITTNGSFIAQQEVMPDSNYKFLNYFVSRKTIDELRELSIDVKD